VVDRATDAEVLGMLRACRSARDHFIVTAMARAGLRRGEVTGLRRQDMHLVCDATTLGCAVPGAHLHVHAGTTPTGPGRNHAVLVRFPSTNCWSWPTTPTGSSGRNAGPPAGATSC